MRKLTTEEFIVKAKIVHGDKYDYSKTVYIKSNEKLEINCYKHGSFWQLANSHLLGKGCIKCRNDDFRNNLRNNINKFIEAAQKVHEHTYDYSLVKYLGNKIKLRLYVKNTDLFGRRQIII